MKWNTYTPEEQEVIKELVVAVYHEFFYNQIYFDNWEELVLELAEIIKSNHASVSLANQHYKTDFAGIKKDGSSEIRYQQKRFK